MKPRTLPRPWQTNGQDNCPFRWTWWRGRNICHRRRRCHGSVGTRLSLRWNAGHRYWLGRNCTGHGTRCRSSASSATASPSAFLRVTTGNALGGCGPSFRVRALDSVSDIVVRLRPSASGRFFIRRSFLMGRLCLAGLFVIERRLQGRGCRFCPGFFRLFLAPLQAVAHPFPHVWLVTYPEGRGQSSVPNPAVGQGLRVSP